ncbi:4-alpha-glucanotransferase [Fimicolochytrium jonesii]|uniref:4-alpha-glucanotransferase n=1 Tax=Fimicolochytrium jonesii TaxID=1396493 RepID=UPI0022FE03EC|nr:4-alpha-glucanotransferase [Fimicolochytrium jonesii]KAI8826698.1 4-alpha-glucanotransferase [Fimicolochytrium jonesii]
MPSTRASSAAGSRKVAPADPFPGRCSGVLLHVTSLPSNHGIGDVGPTAIRFVDWLSAAGQSIWQFLPLNPHGYAGSPYGTPSAMAANPAIVSLEPLIEEGLLTAVDVKELETLPRGKVDYDRVTPLKRQALRLARDRFRSTTSPFPKHHEWLGKLEQFIANEGAAWLNDYALFAALHEKHNACWIDWPAELRDRKPAALAKAQEELYDEIDEHIFTQFLFDMQWAQVRRHAKEKGVRLVGDIPIFVAYDSADVWSHRKLFKLDAQGKQTVQAGVPPDYFSETGQLWGNPVYDWAAIATEGYKWWTLRFSRTLALADIIRIDHFRGFEAAWEVPASHKTAMNGTWVKGPGAKVFRAVDKALGYRTPVIAEDLGLITQSVHDLRDELGYPGMKVLQFAWGGDSYDATNDHLPHNLKTSRCVYYTGTHDNDTVRGWADSATDAQRAAVLRYLGRDASKSAVADGKRKREEDGDAASAIPAAKKPDNTTANGPSSLTEKAVTNAIPTVSWDFIHLALASVADIAIVQLQDVLDLGTEARMNTPATADGNWSWRVDEAAVTKEIGEKLRGVTEVFGRVREV